MGEKAMWKIMFGNLPTETMKQEALNHGPTQGPNEILDAETKYLAITKRTY